ncbi:hypothetical protein SprV_0100273400 [Sparganum proliferum]
MIRIGTVNGGGSGGGGGDGDRGGGRDRGSGDDRGGGGGGGDCGGDYNGDDSGGSSTASILGNERRIGSVDISLGPWTPDEVILCPKCPLAAWTRR